MITLSVIKADIGGYVGHSSTHPDMIELGKEGTIVSMRLKELVGNLNKEEDIILKDYFNARYDFARSMLEKMSFDFLLEIPNLSRMLFEELYDKQISPKGFRLLGKTKILERHITALTNKFGNLNEIISASEEKLSEIFENNEAIDFFNKEINRLKEKILLGKDIR